ncbi:stress-activated map kinase interacting protein 1-domain-containing protein [Glomus cerebriforme]|uniref:Stress-activated map kinase interacting protein 1-domain-containing protein n=1 Tax=Glomus cerebriforme TaxID=658196 RepID=A0A397SHM5_9GLOM|nr:stress-activated map kinase interacting protein 1-domain-containing protein [Glomus cerebriforme]
MSLLNDPDYIIHQLRIGYLRRVGDRIGERVITFNPTVLSNDYIKTAAPSYPEMLACHSPNISMSGNDYFSSKSVTSSAAGSPISGGRAKTLTHSNRSRDTTSMQAVREDSSYNNNKTGDSDDDIDMDDEDTSKQPPPLFTKRNLPKQIVAPPPVFVTSPSKPPTSRPSLVAHSFSPGGGALKTSPDSILGISSNEQTPQLSPTTSAESDRVLAERRGSEASLLTTDGTDISSSPPPRPSLSAAEEKKLLPDPPKNISKPKPFSALTALIAEKKSKLDNPFVEEYSFFAGKGDLNPLTLKIFLPFSTKPSPPLVVVVKRDATVEEVIGYTLYQYWDEKRKPALEPNLCNVSQWNMRIVEDDGEIDFDFPVPDRTREISKFATDQFALCKANSSEVKQNEAVSAKSRPSPKEPLASPSIKSNGSTVNATSTTTAVNSSTTAVSSAIDLTNQIFLRIRLTPYSEVAEVAHTTTINVSADMHFYDVLEIVCRKRKLDPKDYTFKIADTNTYLDLEKIVESIGNSQELALVKKQSPPSSPTTPKERGQTKRRTLNEPPQPQYVSSNEYMSVYKKYTVNRKIPMFVGRHERVLAIDGDYIHIMPSETRTMFESMKTSSYHITSVMSCKANKKSPSSFKLEIFRDSGTKTYDFEAESPKVATEICQKVKFLMGLYNSDKSKTRYSKY